MPFIGRSEMSSALEGLTPVDAVSSARPRRVGRPEWNEQQAAAALMLATHAHDRAELLTWLRMCGLLSL